MITIYNPFGLDYYDRKGYEIYIDDEGSFYGIDDRTGRRYEITEEEVEAIA